MRLSFFGEVIQADFGSLVFEVLGQEAMLFADAKLFGRARESQASSGD